jgi:DNA-binding CsgD family transcriptional regulator
VLADLQAALGHVAFEAALHEGRALSLEEAVAYAERGRGKHNRARSGWESLTPSEQRVVALVGQHLTNAQIAERLFISVPTVKSHLNRAFAKLGMNNRGQLAAGAHRMRHLGLLNRIEDLESFVQALPGAVGVARTENPY